MKTIAETTGKIGDKKIRKREKKDLDKLIKTALMSASNLLKASSVSENQKITVFCLDLKRKIEDIEREYGVSLL